MNELPRLDRLSALLEGLSPRIEVSRKINDGAHLNVIAESPSFLRIYLLAEGEMQLLAPLNGCQAFSGPSILVFRSDLTHTLVAPSPASFQHLMIARAFLDGPVGTLLLNEFASPQLVQLDGAEPSLRHVTALIASELESYRCGQPALLERAGHILFIGLLRHLIAHPSNLGHGLLSGLADPRIARALVAIHSRPQGPWRLESLAAEAGMSRTAFANRFREVMKETPGKYLSAVRLSIAQRTFGLGKGLKAAAHDAGFRNISALSRALSRVSVSKAPN